ncbi:PDDEXK nuclease domain-containing protein [Pasteurella testudinis]|uniref:PDDEXK nuclease domain-containing protein n=1 Tax=Pasteurella testudinis TaxID=761 RepID=UPI0040591E82
MRELTGNTQDFYGKIAQLLQLARTRVVQTVNSTMVATYYEIGRLIVEEELQGKERAEYGKKILKDLSTRLSAEFGRGFSEDNLGNMRKFYTIYQPQISETLSRKSDKTTDVFSLSWSHYLKLMRISDENERRFYEIECAKNHWSLREFQRQYDSALYTRLALSRNKSGVLTLSKQGQVIEKAQDIIKDPYVLEFIGLPEKADYSESDLEQRLIDKLEHFLLELGTGFTFVARQKRISFDEKHFHIDLVFYNRLLKAFVLIDLKNGELKHQDIGQMQMYVNYFDREVRLPDENKTIGLILCRDKSEAVVRYTLPENNEQIFASQYQTVLPSKEKLIALLQEKEK